MRRCGGGGGGDPLGRAGGVGVCVGGDAVGVGGGAEVRVGLGVVWEREGPRTTSRRLGSDRRVSS